MAGYENIKNKGFDKRTTEEPREISSKGGKASGESRRRKTNFRKTLNQALTSEISNPEWEALFQVLGVDNTLESAINVAMIKKALLGDVKAYIAIRDTLGQTTKSDRDIDEQNEKIKAMKLENEEKGKKAEENDDSKLSDFIERVFKDKE